LPLEEEEKPARAPAPVGPAAAPAPAIQGPVTTRCTVQEGAQTRTFTVTLEPLGADGSAPSGAAAAGSSPAPAPSGNGAGTPVFSTFAGAVEVVDILKKEGDRVSEGDVIAVVEAMKATHDIRTPIGGTVRSVHAAVGREIDQTTPIMTIG